MDVDFIQNIFEIVFKGHLLYLAPLLFLLMSLVFAEQMIGLIKNSFSSNEGGRRSRY